MIILSPGVYRGFYLDAVAVFALQNDLFFPPVELSESDGLLAIGGDLSTERLLLAYRSGIFPWYDGDYILWWSPDPRFVLDPRDLRVSKSMKSLLKKNSFKFTMNTAFNEVIAGCRHTVRKDQDGTWITGEMETAYMRLFEEGYAISAEVWDDSGLAGGLYGVKLGKVFFGESMFSRASNASKFAFIRLVEALVSEGVELIDCQVYTQHLETLGAKMISRAAFTRQLQTLINASV